MKVAIDVTAAQLRADPRRYHGLRVRFRDIVHNEFEGMSAAGAWWTPTGGDARDEGAHLADVIGEWSARGNHGHFGLWPAEIHGAAHKVSFDAPRRVEPRALAGAEALVPLEVEGSVRCLLQGLFWDGLELHRLADAPGLPRVDVPHERDLRARLCRDGARLHVFSIDAMGAPRAIQPTLVRPEALGALEGGAFVEVEAALALGDRAPVLTPPGWPACVSWPRLAGALDVVIPEIAGTPSRYAVPNVKSPGIARWLELLAHGPRKVRAVGEVRIARDDPPSTRVRRYLWATELEVI